MRRTAAWKPIAGVAAATIAIAGFGVAPASAAPGDTAEAFGEVLGVELLGSDDLLASAFSQSAFPSNPGIDANGLNLGLLGGDLELIENGLVVPLIHAGEDNGLLNLGGAGLLSSYASASGAADAVASAGLLDEDGGLALDPNEEPPSGTGSSSIDLTALLGDLGVAAVTDEIVDQVALELGAFGSRASEVDDVFDSEYLLSDLTLDVHSDLVAGLTTQLRSGLTGVTTDLRTDLNGLAGPDGAVQDLLDGLDVDLNALGLASLTLDNVQVNVTAPDLSAAVDTALGGSNGVLVSDDQSVTIDLATGTVSVDLAQIVNPDGVGLNGLDPNTQILDADTIQALTTGIASALGDITTPLTNSVSTLLNTTSLTVGFDVAASAALPLGIGTIPIIDGSVLISGTIGQFANGTATSQVNVTLIPGLIASLGPLGPLVQTLVNGLVAGLVEQLVSTTVPAVVAGLATPVAGILAATSGDVSSAIQGVVVGVTNLLSPALAGVAGNIASITVNVQPHLAAGGGQPLATNRDGFSTMSGTEEVDIPDGYTVRALTVTLLPNALGSNLANIDLGSSSVSNVEPSAVAGTLELTPPRVHQDDVVDIAGSGWNPDGGPVSVAFVDENGDPVGTPVTATLDGDGGITGTFTVPGDATLGTLTGTATQDGAPASASVDVFGDPIIIVDPEPPLDPGTPVTISGEGFVCGPLTVDILDGDDVVDTFPNVPVSETDGSWSIVWDVPEDIDVTQVTIRAYGSGECQEDEETPVDIDLPEDFDVTQAEARLGDVLDITGSGWTEGTPVTVTFSNGGTTVGTVSTDPGTGGVLDDTFTVPLTAPLGTLDATAVQGDDTLTDAIQVFGAATVAVDPTSVRAGGTVAVDGTGWLPNGGDVVVTATVGTTVVGTVTIAQADIAADGTIAGELTIADGTAAGPVTVTAAQGDVDADTSLTVLPEPTVTVFPTTARPLDTVDIGGSGWGPGPVTVVFENGDGVIGTVTVDPVDGTLDDEFVIPDGTDPGTVTVTATQGDDEATAELEITLAPTVSAAPPQVHGGDTVTIGGSGWGDDDVTVTITDGTTVIGAPITLTPVDGVIAGPYAIPEGTDPADLVVTADDGTDDATTAVEVLADAIVEAEPDPVDPGDPVTITGTGFLCGPVDITIASGATVIMTYASVPVVDNGWTQIWTVPTGIDVDSVTITAVTSASAPCDDGGETELEIDLEETLAAAPSVVQRGEVVTVSGTGWSDGAVSIIATATGGAVVGSFTATSADSAFSQGFYVQGVVPLGPLTFTAVQDGKTETATVTVVQVPAGPATLIVSPSAVEPGQLVALDGEGWDPTQGTVAVSVTDEDGVVLGTVPVAVAPDGALLTGAYQVPATIAAPQTLTATGVQGPRSATDTFSVRAAGDPVIRLAGPDRFQTAVEISRDAFPFGADVVYLANGLKFPDALSAAPAAAQQDAPLLLTRQEYLEPSVIQELDRLDPDIVVILGDENSVSANVASQVDPYAGDIVRLGGANRFETSILIAEYAFNGADSAYIATGLNFPDALTAGAAAGALNAPLLLTYGATPTPGLIASLQGLGVEDLYIAGDGNAVATSQETAFTSAGFTIAERYAGENRFDTGVLVAQDSFAGSADRIYVATGLRFPDALAGSAIAGAQGVPVFVTRPTCMWADVLGEVDRLDDPQIVLLGDQNALDQSVFDLTACTG